MRIHELAPVKGSRKARKRVGRGPGSGHGRTACRGHKGQRSRSGGGTRPGFEGGQMPLHRRLPKRGFTNIFKKQYGIVNVGDLAGFEPNSVIDPQALMGAGVLKRVLDGVKMLGEGEVIHPFSVKVQRVSRTARQKIEAAGGTVQVI